METTTINASAPGALPAERGKTMKTLHSLYGLPDSTALNGMFSQESTEWVEQDKVDPDEETVVMASVGPFSTGGRAPWWYLWEVVMSERIGFAVYLTEAADGTHIMGAKKA
jgi:hypothetical protein